MLRVGLDKDVAARYPAFDRDEFATLSDDALHGYQGRLLDFFKRDDGEGRPERGAEESQPEWLMTGVWMTIPPALAEQLSDEAGTSRTSSRRPSDDRRQERSEDRALKSAMISRS